MTLTDIVVLDMPLLDTRKEKNLMGAFISDIVLYILSFVAENERANIKERQAAGIAAAKARGVKFGRKRKEITPEFIEVYHRWQSHLIVRGKMNLPSRCKNLLDIYNLISAKQASSMCNM